MHPYHSFEKRFATVALDETVLRQRVISYVPAIFATISVGIWAILFWATDLPSLALILLAYFLLSTLILIVATYRPRVSAPAVGMFGATGLLTNTAAHLVAGGFDAGIWFMAWIIMLPLSVYLSGARREGVGVYGLAVLLLAVVVLVDSRLATPLPIPDWVRLLYNAVVLLASVTMTFLWGVYVLIQVDNARQRADSLLLNILPAPIARQLKRNPSTIADGFSEVTVLFADIVDFTTLSANADPVDVVNFLNVIFSDFDDLAAKHGLEKIKTIGDAYMVAGGLPIPRPDHCEAVVAFGLEMLAAVKRRTAWNGEPVRLRVGVNTGPVVAGVIGRRKFIYDLWGDAVNTASRMESNGIADVIQVTTAVKEKLAGLYTFVERPPITIKGKGQMITYLLKP